MCIPVRPFSGLERVHRKPHRAAPRLAPVRLPGLALALLLLAGPAGIAGAEAPETVRRIVVLDGPDWQPPVGARVLHRYVAFPGALVEVPARALPALARAAGVLGVHDDAPLERHLDLAMPALGLAGADAPAETGAGVTVALVDSGIDPAHPGFGGRVERLALAGDSFAPSAVPLAPGAHGTAVAGALAGDGAESPSNRYRGAAPGARVIALDLGEAFSVDTALRAFDWIHENHEARGIRIVTNSWGRATDVDGRFDPGAPLVLASDTLALDDGLLVVFSAGNRGRASSLATEALNPNVLTVGATDAGGVLASFSSRGPGLDAAGAPLAWTKPDLVAPGSRVVTARSATSLDVGALAGDRSLAPALYAEDSGTSLAAPVVAGAAALLLEAAPALAREELAAILLATARDLGAPGADADTGAGLVDPLLALALAKDGSLAASRAERDVAASFPADVVAVAGAITRVGPSPGVSAGGEIVGYLPVLPGATSLRAEVSWTTPALGAFTARLLGPDGEARGALAPDGANALALDVPAPRAGVWEVRAKPAAGFFQASIEAGGVSTAARDVPRVASLAEILPASAEARGEGASPIPAWSVPVALASLAGLALGVRRR